MIIAILIAVAAAYFAYSSISFLTMTPVPEWTPAHLAIVAMTIILIGFAVFFAVRAWKLWKKKAAQINEQIQKQEQKLRDKKRAVYMEDYEAPAPDAVDEAAEESTDNSDADGEAKEAESPDSETGEKADADAAKSSDASEAAKENSDSDKTE